MKEQQEIVNVDEMQMRFHSMLQWGTYPLIE